MGFLVTRRKDTGAECSALEPHVCVPRAQPVKETDCSGPHLDLGSALMGIGRMEINTIAYLRAFTVEIPGGGPGRHWARWVPLPVLTATRPPGCIELDEAPEP